ncbi:lipoprotein-releasing ABC transporter permease subunit LolE [Candidatus Pantoea carbekii]|uniref:Uncharacterized protein n=1 Tax=Candidatus Pantoea carbekii TaxID=1235990 RepID=U3U874_9GAMM|nr:lipoprotein-releasing ABC transporter permease subunit LolE [Candidatus Pantoea carbekii]AKC32121.1 lipoprotein releasing system transmembrane protein [Candidatus Pantoea carbekii]BAO00647.1 hypothetical protein HHS_06770 [Candidatus Pantoea carbekii]
MYLWLPLLFSVRFIYRQQCKYNKNIRSSLISLSSIISTTGIIIGVAALIIGLSAMHGFERELNNRILAVVPHGTIEPVNQPFRNWKKMISKINDIPGIISAMPYITVNGLIENGIKIRMLQLKGIDPNINLFLKSLGSVITNNVWSKFRDNNKQIILGTALAKSLNLKEGSWITIVIPNNNTHHQLKQAQRIRLHVFALLQLNNILDNNLALIPLKDAQTYLKMGTSISGIEIKVTDPFKAELLVNTAAEATHCYVYVHHWMNTYGYMYHDVQIIRSTIYLAMFLVIIVACFNVISTLMMTVKEKSSDIAILRSLGAKNALISAIFICYGLLAGLFGSISGICIGIIVSFKLTSIMHLFEYVIGFHLLNPSIYFIDFLPSEVHWIDICSVFLVVVVLSLVASCYPAWRASRIDPACILK